jgi:ABC-type sugar transport system permease subunit
MTDNTESLRIARRIGVTVGLADSSQKLLIYGLGVAAPLLVYALFVGYPVVSNVYLSLTRWNGLSPTVPFVGLGNYVGLASDPGFRLALINTALWSALSLVIHIVVPIGLAIVLFSGRVFAPTLFRALLFVPVTMSLVAVGLMYSLILSPGFGIVDQAFRSVGLGGLVRTWLGDYDITLYVLILIDCWTYIGVPLMLFHAGLGSLDPHLVDAARIDGASPVQIVRYVIVPSLRPVVLIVTMLSVIRSLRTFDLVSVMTHGGPAGGTTVLGYFMYYVSFSRNQFGYGAAVAVVMLILSLGFALVYLRGVARNALHVDY